MRIISTGAHISLDYIVGVFLIVMPYIFGFADRTAAQWIPTLLGAAAIVYATATDREGGRLRLIPMPVHLGLDIASGIFLAMSPWLFGFADRVYLPLLIMGLAEIVIASVTEPRPGDEPAPVSRVDDARTWR
jgi:hypothetical protein